MKDTRTSEVQKFVEEHIQEFHNARLRRLGEIRLGVLLRKKNPYLFRAKNLVTASEFVSSILDANLSSSEEEIFGQFLEHLAIFISEKTLGAKKSAVTGIDFEYNRGKTRYLVAVKSGLNWGNSSQWTALENNFKTAMKVLGQSRSVDNIKCILGVCYGKTRTTTKRGFITQICGQAFWHLISGKKEFYKSIVEPLGFRAKELNLSFRQRKSEIVNKFTAEFIKNFCDHSGRILWEKVVEFNSSNLGT